MNRGWLRLDQDKRVYFDDADQQQNNRIGSVRRSRFIAMEQSGSFVVDRN
jgi:hypothetical protein